MPHDMRHYFRSSSIILAFLKDKGYCVAYEIGWFAGVVVGVGWMIKATNPSEGKLSEERIHKDKKNR